MLCSAFIFGGRRRVRVAEAGEHARMRGTDEEARAGRGEQGEERAREEPYDNEGFRLAIENMGPYKLQNHRH